MPWATTTSVAATTACWTPGCDCPDSDANPIPVLDKNSSAFAFTAGTADAQAKLDGTKLDDFCKKGITGTWTGTWAIGPVFGSATGGFTMTLIQKGTSFSGTTVVTGPTCVSTGQVDGTVTGSNLQFGWITDVAAPVQFEGTVGAKSMSGTWNAIRAHPRHPDLWSWDATRVSGAPKP